MKRYACQHENDFDEQFCEECGNKRSGVCSTCGVELEPTAQLCSDCGAPWCGSRNRYKVSHSQCRRIHPAPSFRTYRAEQAVLEGRGAADGERKAITALFADLKGATALIEGPDPEEVRAGYGADNRRFRWNRRLLLFNWNAFSGNDCGTRRRQEKHPCDARRLVVRYGTEPGVNPLRPDDQGEFALL